MREALLLKAQIGLGQNTTSTLITHHVTKNSRIFELTHGIAGTHLTANEAILNSLYQKSRQQQLLGLHDRGTVRELDESLYVQVGDSPVDSHDKDDDYQSAGLLCASPEHIAMKNVEVQQN